MFIYSAKHLGLAAFHVLTIFFAFTSLQAAEEKIFTQKPAIAPTKVAGEDVFNVLPGF
jgi:hypothetical protein